MDKIFLLLVEIVVIVSVSLYTGKVTVFDNGNMTIERPFTFVSTLLILLGFLFFQMGMKTEILNR